MTAASIAGIAALFDSAPALEVVAAAPPLVPLAPAETAVMERIASMEEARARALLAAAVPPAIPDAVRDDELTPEATTPVSEALPL